MLRSNSHTLKRHSRLFLSVRGSISIRSLRDRFPRLRISALKAQRLHCSRLLALRVIHRRLSSLHHSIASLKDASVELRARPGRESSDSQRDAMIFATASFEFCHSIGLSMRLKFRAHARVLFYDGRTA
jgi:hypothetical protein